MGNPTNNNFKIKMNISTQTIEQLIENLASRPAQCSCGRAYTLYDMTSLIESKNELVRENYLLREEIRKLKEGK